MDYNKGEVVTFTVEIRKQVGGDLFDPASITISISKNAISKVSEQPMIKTSQGLYYYDWTTDERGFFKIEYKAMDGANPTFKKDILKVV